MAELARAMIIVSEGTNEDWLAHNEYVDRYSASSLHLVIMPTEQCNFRCTYCYESFARGEMAPSLQDAIVKHVTQRQHVRKLEVSWFGGEPLLASRVMLSLMSKLGAVCRARGIRLISGATTNGYLLDLALATQLIKCGVSQYQITIDGIQDDHDCRRRGAVGEPTYETILRNLRDLRDSRLDFRIMLRHNFDRHSIRRLDQFLETMAAEFATDDRFTMYFQGIGKWGGPNDATLDTCDQRSSNRELAAARMKAVKRGLQDAMTLSSIQPSGSVCYAADPNSFVIGSDGRLYKCTVELDYHDRNVVGRLLEDGRMDLNWEKMALWTETNGMSGDKKCSSCWFSPACHGGACPKEWLDEHDCTCPPGKTTIGTTLDIINLDALRRAQRVEGTAQCSR